MRVLHRCPEEDFRQFYIGVYYFLIRVATNMIMTRSTAVMICYATVDMWFCAIEKDS